MISPSKGNKFMLFLIVFQILLSFGIPSILNFLSNGFNQDLSLSLNDSTFLVMWQMLSLFVPFTLYLLVTRQQITDVLPLNKINFLNTVFIILITLSAQPFAMLLSSLSSLVFRNEVSELMLALYAQPFYVVVLVTCAVPALLEEIVMRGLILGNYKQVNIRKAALVNGLFFGIMHMAPQQFLYAFALGAIFAYFVYYTKSIFASIIAHFSFNFTQSLMMNSVVSNPDYQMELANSTTQTDVMTILSGVLSMTIISLIFLPVFLILFKSFISYNKHRNLTYNLRHYHFHELVEQPHEQAKTYTWAFWVVILIYLVFMTLPYIPLP